MAKRLIALAVALLVLGFAAAGCGDDDSPSGSADTTTEATDQTVADDAVTDTEADTDADTGGADADTATGEETVPEKTEAPPVTTTPEGGRQGDKPRTPKQAVGQCKGAVSGSLLSADAKQELIQLCEKARSGDPDDVRQALGGVCKRMVEETIPAGAPGRERALSACDRQAEL